MLNSHAACFQNIPLRFTQRTYSSSFFLGLLFENGCTLKDCVLVHLFVKDMTKFVEVNEVYKDYFTENPPARYARFLTLFRYLYATIDTNLNTGNDKILNDNILHFFHSYECKYDKALKNQKKI